ncbi:hypothetical protein GCM10009589_40280 [Arthrobacter pascens]
MPDTGGVLDPVKSSTFQVDGYLNDTLSPGNVKVARSVEPGAAVPAPAAPDVVGLGAAAPDGSALGEAGAGVAVAAAVAVVAGAVAPAAAADGVALLDADWATAPQPARLRAAAARAATTVAW